MLFRLIRLNFMAGFIPFNLLMATFLLLVSEVVGVIEELVWKNYGDTGHVL